jgi:hypothetical protein
MVPIELYKVVLSCDKTASVPRRLVFRSYLVLLSQSLDYPLVSFCLYTVCQNIRTARIELAQQSSMPIERIPGSLASSRNDPRQISQRVRQAIIQGYRS